ncbi:MAG: sigma-70 family RNA polymerase sigma factor [Planctomycetes bacterium]|nr:sigma-70 family RNA polymerase sigma factor [Planctomycetota bacterium]
MARGNLHSFVEGLCQRLHDSGGVPDAELLGRWIAGRDEAAFELLLRRHAPLVHGVCRRLLDDPRDVEDAFQATFLLLLRKATAIRNSESLGSWLYKVAYRVALRARADRARAGPSTSAGLEDVFARPDEDLLWRDLRPVLDEEVRGLPEKYRVPFILCHLQGKTNQEAADALGCPLGTILSRLSWARERLRNRLTRRGLAVSTAVLVTALSRNACPAAVPPALLRATLGILTPPAAAGAGAARSHLLAEGVRKAMFLTKLKLTTALAVVVCLLGLGTLAVSHQAAATPAPGYLGGAGDKDGDTDGAPPAKKRDWIIVPARQSGVVELIGRELRPGEKVPADKLITMRTAGQAKQYVRLVEGDAIRKGELLARLDEALARFDVDIKVAQVGACETEAVASGKTKDEAQVRYDALLQAARRAPGSVSPEELRGAKLTWERYIEDEKAKRHAITVAKQELQRAKFILNSYEIRSPVDGVITAILKKEGEAVRQLEGVFRIRIVAARK